MADSDSQISSGWSQLEARRGKQKGNMMSDAWKN